MRNQALAILATLRPNPARYCACFARLLRLAGSTEARGCASDVLGAWGAGVDGTRLRRAVGLLTLVLRGEVS